MSNNIELASLPLKNQYVQITMLNWNEEPIQQVEGYVTSGTVTISGDSPLRRTGSITVEIDKGTNNLMEPSNLFSINKKIKIQVGITNQTNDIEWFPLGLYIIKDANVAHDVSKLTATLQLQDKTSLLNGDCGGTFPAAVQLDTTVDANGISTKISIAQMIREMVNHYGKEQLGKIKVDLAEYARTPLMVSESDKTHTVKKYIVAIKGAGHWNRVTGKWQQTGWESIKSDNWQQWEQGIYKNDDTWYEDKDDGDFDKTIHKKYTDSQIKRCDTWTLIEKSKISLGNNNARITPFLEGKLSSSGIGWYTVSDYTFTHPYYVAIDTVSRVVSAHGVNFRSNQLQLSTSQGASINLIEANVIGSQLRLYPAGGRISRSSDTKFRYSGNDVLRALLKNYYIGGKLEAHNGTTQGYTIVDVDDWYIYLDGSLSIGIDYGIATINNALAKPIPSIPTDEGPFVTNGSRIGYTYIKQYYPKELKMTAGQTCVDALNDIQSTLGNYEYFFDLDGNFIFQEKQNYAATAYSTLLARDLYAGKDLNQPRAQHIFDNCNLTISLNSAPSYSQIKNDYAIWGVRKTVSGSQMPLYYHLAIDKKPQLREHSHFVPHFNLDTQCWEALYVLPVTGSNNYQLGQMYGQTWDRYNEGNQNELKPFAKYKVIVDGTENKAELTQETKIHKIYTYRKVWHYEVNTENTNNNNNIVTFSSFLYLPHIGQEDKIYIITSGNTSFKWSSSYQLVPYYDYPDDALIVNLDNLGSSYVNIKWNFIRQGDIDSEGGIVLRGSQWEQGGPFEYYYNRRRQTDQTQYYDQEELENAYFICDGKLYQCVYCDWADTASDGYYHDTILFSEIEVPTYDNDYTITPKDWRTELYLQHKENPNCHEYGAELDSWWIQSYNIWGNTTATIISNNDNNTTKYIISKPSIPVRANKHKLVYKDKSADIISVTESQTIDNALEITLGAEITIPTDVTVDIEFVAENQIFDSEVAGFYDKSEIPYMLELIDNNSWLNEYSVDKIGRRSKVLNDDNINYIYEPLCPEVVYIDKTDKEAAAKRDAAVAAGYTVYMLSADKFNLLSAAGSTYAADDAAAELLATHTNYADKITTNMIAVYDIEPNTCIYLKDDACGIDGEYNVDSVSLQLESGTMNVSATRITERV